MREEFIKMLENLDKNLIIMSNLVENAITFSVEALISKETENCKRVMSSKNRLMKRKSLLKTFAQKFL